jgi:hypothetical protein
VKPVSGEEVKALLTDFVIKKELHAELQNLVQEHATISGSLRNFALATAALSLLQLMSVLPDSGSLGMTMGYAALGMSFTCILHGLQLSFRKQLSDKALEQLRTAIRMSGGERLNIPDALIPRYKSALEGTGIELNDVKEVTQSRVPEGQR